jgi:hypothetical protein
VASKSKGTSAADIAAAVALGVMDGDTLVVTADDAAAEVAAVAAAITAEPVIRPESVALSATDHGCGIVGCRHGSAHTGTPQRDRQLKLATECGAVARITASALARAGGTLTDGHGHAFAVAERRAYNRKAA